LYDIKVDLSWKKGFPSTTDSQTFGEWRQQVAHNLWQASSESAGKKCEIYMIVFLHLQYQLSQWEVSQECDCWTVKN
jgi:hypothetical protein